MTYGRVGFEECECNIDGAVVSHSAELVRGHFLCSRQKGPLIRPSGTFSPRGEGVAAAVQ
jgi:hypothetical protein